MINVLIGYSIRNLTLVTFRPNNKGYQCNSITKHNTTCMLWGRFRSNQLSTCLPSIFFFQLDLRKIKHYTTLLKKRLVRYSLFSYFFKLPNEFARFFCVAIVSKSFCILASHLIFHNVKKKLDYFLSFFLEEEFWTRVTSPLNLGQNRC